MMEFKLGSVMLLLSCSLQQSLWGILASMPQTNADRCKKISSEGGQTKRVQMIRRIPARCSGWDEAWSWISNKDCRTKYVMDYVEIPSAVQKVDPEDCKQEEDPPTEKGLFNVADEKYLAIAFGSATVALLILIVIIVISVIRRGQNRCRMCGSGPTYSSASASEREHLDSAGGNEYVGDEFKLAEPVYEEIIDGQRVRKRLEICNDLPPPSYENVMNEEKDLDEVKSLPMNGAHHRPITPSAPYAEELQHSERTCVPNDYSVLKNKLVKKSEGTDDAVEGATGFDPDETKVLTVYNARDSVIQNGTHIDKVSRSLDNHNMQCGVKSDDSIVRSIGTPGEVSDPLVDFEDLVSTKSHSYENLEEKDSGEYDTLNQSTKSENNCVSPKEDEEVIKSETDASSSRYINVDTFTPVTYGTTPSKDEIQHSVDSDSVNVADIDEDNVDTTV